MDLEREPCQELADMRCICAGTLTAASGLTPFQAKLLEQYNDNFDKFTVRMERLQLSHDQKVKVIDAKEAAQAGGAVPEADEGHVKVEDLLEELLDEFDATREQELRSQRLTPGAGPA